MPVTTVAFQYQETLIWLIDKNDDDQWTEDFHNLRNGGSLAWGGAGSVNDWGPSYSDFYEDCWYGDLYDIIFEVFRASAGPDDVLKNVHLRDCNKSEIIRCLACRKSYQHPAIFESLIANLYYAKYLVGMIGANNLMMLVRPEYSYRSEEAVGLRNWLKGEYDKHNIKIYDFVTGKYVCPHCGAKDFKTEHDQYLIGDAWGNRTFAFSKASGQPDLP